MCFLLLAIVKHPLEFTSTIGALTGSLISSVAACIMAIVIIGFNEANDTQFFVLLLLSIYAKIIILENIKRNDFISNLPGTMVPAEDPPEAAS